MFTSQRLTHGPPWPAWRAAGGWRVVVAGGAASPRLTWTRTDSRRSMSAGRARTSSRSKAATTTDAEGWPRDRSIPAGYSSLPGSHVLGLRPTGRGRPLAPISTRPTAWIVRPSPRRSVASTVRQGYRVTLEPAAWRPWSRDRGFSEQ